MKCCLCGLLIVDGYVRSLQELKEILTREWGWPSPIYSDRRIICEAMCVPVVHNAVMLADAARN
jgi:hypothetical protein